MLKVEELSKKYKTFEIKDISFQLPEGVIMGFIGANGAGKTTTLKSILNLTRPDSGTVQFLNMDMFENEVKLKQSLGFMMGPIEFYPKSTVAKVLDVYRKFYATWNEKEFAKLVTKFQLDTNKKISELSMGMKVKLGIAMALSHDAKLIILDEPTSGLDPVARDELLDLFRDIVSDGNHSILFSTHITSDLEKCADHILYIKDGRIIANNTKECMIAEYRLVSGAKDALSSDLKSKMIGWKEVVWGFEGLIRTDSLADISNVKTVSPTLEDIMVFHSKDNRI